MNIERLLKAYPNAPDEAMLEMILSNRIDMGSASGGMISVAQFGTLTKDLIVWRAWCNRRAVNGAASTPRVDGAEPVGTV